MEELRKADPEKDGEAIKRIWKEIGWLEKGKEEVFDILQDIQGRNYVADIQGVPECNVTTCTGKIRYLKRDLPISLITAVLTSNVARKRGLAARLTAKAIAEDAAEGAYVSSLGVFDQGFYNQMGFGTGSYSNWLYFDPATLDVPSPHRTPERITKKDWEKVHRARLNRMKHHGMVDMDDPVNTRVEMMWATNGFGLGYFDDDGEISHHIYFNAKDLNGGKYSVWWMSYRNREEFMELMSILKSLSDQVQLIGMREPPNIQFQDILRRPFRHRRMTRESKFENKMESSAYWQMRILDLESCIEAFSHQGPSVRFKLSIKDPVEDLLEKKSIWKGTSGDYTITLGEESSVDRAGKRSLPRLKTTINAFSRLWLGVRPASSLAMTDEFFADAELIKELDEVFILPTPHPDWDF